MSTGTWRRETDGAPNEAAGGEPDGTARGAAPPTMRLPGITSAVAASLGAGAVHAAAVGGYSDHPAAARILVMVAAAQLLAAVAAYYYSLETTLLVKSELLAVIGLGLLGLRLLALRRLWPDTEDARA